MSADVVVTTRAGAAIEARASSIDDVDVTLAVDDGVGDGGFSAL